MPIQPMTLKEQSDFSLETQVKCRLILSMWPVAAISETERLQSIDDFSKTPFGAQINRVIDFLYETRQGFTPKQINKACDVDMHENVAFFRCLRFHIKVRYRGRKFYYRPRHNVKDKSQLLSLLRKFPHGIEVVELEDAYLNVMEDLEALKASGHIWVVSNADTQKDIAYPNDINDEITVDDEFKSLFRDIDDIPSDMFDVKKELLEIGVKPACMMNTVQIHNKPKRKRKKKEFMKTKLTNTHLLELLETLSAQSSLS